MLQVRRSGQEIRQGGGVLGTYWSANSGTEREGRQLATQRQGAVTHFASINANANVAHLVPDVPHKAVPKATASRVCRPCQLQLRLALPAAGADAVLVLWPLDQGATAKTVAIRPARNGLHP